MDIEKMIDTGFRGVVSVRRGDEVIFEKSCGCADMANEIPNSPELKYATASAGKAFVATGILQLIEAGRLSLDTTLGELSLFDLHAIDPAITVRQLLTHTSGIPDYFDESVMEDYDELWRDYPNYKIRNSAALLPLFIEKPMMYPAGERFQYNNTGFLVLGMIIEKLTGASFDEYLSEHVFKPCGMESTGYYELDRLPAKCASNYIFDRSRGEYYTNIYSVDVKGTGAGGAFTTLSDVKRFWDALLSNRLLSAEMTRDMLAIHSRDGDGDYYGYGVWLKRSDNGHVYPYIQGCDPGVSFMSVRHIATNTTLSAVSNFGDNVWKLLYDIRYELIGE